MTTTDAWDLLRKLWKAGWHRYEPKPTGTFLFEKLFDDPGEFPAELTKLQAAHGGSPAICRGRHPLGGPPVREYYVAPSEPGLPPLPMPKAPPPPTGS